MDTDDRITPDERPVVIIHTGEDGQHEMSRFCWCEPRIEIFGDEEWVMVQ